MGDEKTGGMNRVGYCISAVLDMKRYNGWEMGRATQREHNPNVLTCFMFWPPGLNLFTWSAEQQWPRFWAIAFKCQVNLSKAPLIC